MQNLNVEEVLFPSFRIHLPFLQMASIRFEVQGVSQQSVIRYHNIHTVKLFVKSPHLKKGPMETVILLPTTSGLIHTVCIRWESVRC